MVRVRQRECDLGGSLQVALKLVGGPAGSSLLLIRAGGLLLRVVLLVVVAVVGISGGGGGGAAATVVAQQLLPHDVVLERPSAERPVPRGPVEAVEREEAVAVRGDEVDGGEHEAELVAGEVVGEADPRPPGLHAVVPPDDGVADAEREVLADAEERVAVGPRARAPAPGLDPEQVVEELGDEPAVQGQPPPARRGPCRRRRQRGVVVGVASARVDEEGEDGEAARGDVAEHLDVGVAEQPRHGRLGVDLLPQRDGVAADVLLDPERQRRAHLLHDRRRAGVLPLLDVVVVHRVLQNARVRASATGSSCMHACTPYGGCTYASLVLVTPMVQACVSRV